MKKLMIAGCMVGLTLTATAGGEKIDGTTVKRITFNGDLVTIEYNNGVPSTTADMADVTIDMGGETSVKRNLTSTTRSDGGIYDLQGRRLSTLTSYPAPLKKGLYIIGGKKTVVKERTKSEK